MTISKQGVSLLELMIATALLVFISLGIWSIETFSRYHLRTSEIRSRLQNEASLPIEHITKYMSQTIGTTRDGVEAWVVSTANIGGDVGVRFYIDSNRNSRRDAMGTDTMMAYRWYGTAGGDAYQLKFCPQCQNANCTNCNPNWNAAEILSDHMTCFGAPNCQAGTPPTVTNNYVSLEIRLCHDVSTAAMAATCGSVDNPTATMRTNIRMSAVPAN